MAATSLKRIVCEHQNFIFAELLNRLALLPQSPYLEFAKSEEGHLRVRIWIRNMIAAIGGRPEIFFADTEKIGYQRAHQGFKLDFIVQFYRIFHQIVWEIVKEVSENAGDDLSLFTGELHELGDILLQGLSIVTESYLDTREEIIKDKVREIERGRQEMRRLAGNTIAVQEEERRRLAGDIHDSLTQSLTGIGYKLQYCRELITKDPTRLAHQFDTLVDAVHRAIDQSREIMSNLRPDLIDTLGLVAALKRHIENFSQETGIRVNTRLPARLQLSSEQNICLFRMVQEALMNVYKHANVNTAEVILKKGAGAVRLSVADRGRGFENPPNAAAPGHEQKLGLLILRERVESVGGRLSLQTTVNGGCRLEAVIPVDR